MFEGRVVLPVDDARLDRLVDLDKGDLLRVLSEGSGGLQVHLLRRYTHFQADEIFRPADRPNAARVCTEALRDAAGRDMEAVRTRAPVNTSSEVTVH